MCKREEDVGREVAAWNDLDFFYLTPDIVCGRVDVMYNITDPGIRWKKKTRRGGRRRRTLFLCFHILKSSGGIFSSNGFDKIM